MKTETNKKVMNKFEKTYKKLSFKNSFSGMTINITLLC